MEYSILDKIAVVVPYRKAWIVKRGGMIVNHKFKTRQLAEEHAQVLNAFLADKLAKTAKRIVALNIVPDLL